MSDVPPRPGLVPALLINLRQGYGAGDLRKDVLAGLTVAIVALPLSMAIAIASHAPPQAGLFTAIIGGFVISALGGSRYQIGGPAGAFIVLMAAIIDKHGLPGLLQASFMAGCIIGLLGLLRLGSLVRFVPHPVIIGFTAGIGTIIFASQLHDLLGLTLKGAEPAPMLAKLAALAGAWASLNPWAVAASGASVAIILTLRRLAPRIPALLVAVVACTLAVALLQLPVETIAARFGAVPSSLPMPAIPAFSLQAVWLLLPDALAIALLGSIESLLSAVVADGMTGERHNANMELVAQGLANIGAALFGGLAATGTIARTATNVKAGAHGPVAGMLHALLLLVLMAMAAPLLGYIPLAALAGILAVVAFNMVDWHELGPKLLASRANTLVVVLTFALTVFEDLLTGIALGTAVWWGLHHWSLRNKAAADAKHP